MLGKLVSPEIHELIQSHDYRGLKELVSGLQPPDLADIVQDLEVDDRVLVFRLLPKELATDVFENLEFAYQESLLNGLKQETIRRILEEMSPDDRTALFEELPSKVTRQFLQLLSPEERRVATQLLNYPEESVGRAMTPDFVFLRPGMSVAQAMEKIRNIGIDRETVYELYVTEKNQKLVGRVSLRRLVTSPLEVMVEDLMSEEVIRVGAGADREEAAELMRHYDLIALPVVDRDDRLVGIVTFDDIMDIVEAEHTEDVHLQAAVLPEEAPYLDISVMGMIRRRIVWLVLLLLAEVAGVLFLRQYDEALSASIALAFFLPVMIATGGNAGTQSAAMVIRALATGEVELRDGLRLMGREMAVGVSLALTLGVLAYLTAVIVNGDPVIGVCVASGLSVIVVLSNLAGTLLPLLFEKLDMDPALMSGPFISTMVDVFGLLIYLEISVQIIRRFSGG